MSDLSEFLNRLGFADAASTPLTGHASPKKYHRIFHAGKSYVVLSCAPETLIRIGAVSKIFKEHKIPSPEIFEQEIESGFALLEDLGDQLLESKIGNHVNRSHSEMFSVALQILIKVQEIPTASVGLPPFSFDTYVLELDTLTDWYLPDVTGKHPTTRVVLEFFESLRSIQPFSNLLPTCLVHRDFYSGNLILGDDNPPSLHVIDFEDACIGSPVYDLVSLLQDLRRDVDIEFETVMKDQYVALKSFSRDEFEIEYATYGVLRALRVLGLWHRLKVRDQKPNYLAYAPYTRKKLEINFAHPALVQVKRSFLKNIGG